MEQTLEKLFDFQRIADNKSLAALIAETESRWGRELSDDDLDLVNAAGIAFPDKKEKSDGN